MSRPAVGSRSRRDDEAIRRDLNFEALEHLFDAELRHQTGMPPLMETGDGVLVGSGDGTLAGPALSGSLRWTLFEQPGELVCAMSPTLRIETSDSALIRADGRGFAAREAVEARDWRVAATLRFLTDDARYAWLDGALGLWAGDFDSERHIARYRAYLHPGDYPWELADRAVNARRGSTARATRTRRS